MHFSPSSGGNDKTPGCFVLHCRYLAAVLLGQSQGVCELAHPTDTPRWEPIRPIAAGSEFLLGVMLAWWSREQMLSLGPTSQGQNFTCCSQRILADVSLGLTLSQHANLKHLFFWTWGWLGKAQLFFWYRLLGGRRSGGWCRWDGKDLKGSWRSRGHSSSTAQSIHILLGTLCKLCHYYCNVHRLKPATSKCWFQSCTRIRHQHESAGDIKIEAELYLHSGHELSLYQWREHVPSPPPTFREFKPPSASLTPTWAVVTYNAMAWAGGCLWNTAFPSQRPLEQGTVSLFWNYGIYISKAAKEFMFRKYALCRNVSWKLDFKRQK